MRLIHADVKAAGRVGGSVGAVPWKLHLCSKRIAAALVYDRHYPASNFPYHNLTEPIWGFLWQLEFDQNYRCVNSKAIFIWSHFYYSWFSFPGPLCIFT